jgi:hypothetical protein
MAAIDCTMSDGVAQRKQELAGRVGSAKRGSSRRWLVIERTG